MIKQAKLALLAGVLLLSTSGLVLAKKGADDPKPQPCDDFSTDVCVLNVELLAKRGADDALPQPCEDNGTDACV